MRSELEQYISTVPENVGMRYESEVIRQQLGRLFRQKEFQAAIAAHRVRQAKFGDSEIPLERYFPLSQEEEEFAETVRLQTVSGDSYVDLLFNIESGIHGVVANYILFTAFEQTSYPPLALGHYISEHWFYDPKQTCRGLFIDLQGPFEWISVVRLDGGGSRGLYDRDRSHDHGHMQRFFFREFTNAGLMPGRVDALLEKNMLSQSKQEFEKWLVITDETFQILHTVDIRDWSIPNYVIYGNPNL